MLDILHSVGVKSASQEDVYRALTTLDGLSGWWTRDASGNPSVDGVIAFRFGPGGFDMKVLELESGTSVLWEVVDGPEEWLGTHIRFDLSRSGDYTTINFKHSGWREQVDFMYHCSTKWATYLISLKELVETGQGRPDPDDLKICDWN